MPTLRGRARTSFGPSEGQNCRTTACGGGDVHVCEIGARYRPPDPYLQASPPPPPLRTPVATILFSGGQGASPGAQFRFLMHVLSGDTVASTLIDSAGRPTGSGRALKVRQ